MVKKRSVFDIDFDLDNGEFPEGNQRAPESKARNIPGHPIKSYDSAPARRGPMASAIAETADATAERSAAEAAIRAENDALAHEHVRLKKLGLITDLIQTCDVVATKLTRDRSMNVDLELEELKESIKAVGLSNPIRVEQKDGAFELIQGFRRLSAFRELGQETGDPRYSRIPAAMVPRGEPIASLYRKMVDENMVRKDLSFGEMAQLALSYARDAEVEPSEAVSTLYASALKQKRTYIRHFARLLEYLGGAVKFPEVIPRALGLDLYRALETDPKRAGALAAVLRQEPGRDAAQELRLLRDALAGQKKKPREPIAKTVSKTSLRLGRPEGDVRVTAQDGRVELRLDRDFSAISKAELQRGIEAFLDALDRGE